MCDTELIPKGRKDGNLIKASRTMWQSQVMMSKVKVNFQDISINKFTMQYGCLETTFLLMQ